jgi:hypothetical protein
MQSILKQSDYMEFLLRLKFGSDDPLSACSRQAYEDFKRTLRGIAKLPKAKEARQQANETLSLMIKSIRDRKAATQKDFDKWHREACDRLAALYRKRGYKSFTVGHAQKWLNMTFKYIYTMGEQRLPGFAHLYGFCHVPLDNILIGHLKDCGFEPLPCAWSKLEKYDVYMDRQLWVRRKFRAEPPLDVEFRLWMGRALD